MILLDSCWEEQGHGIFLLLYVESCLLTSHSMGALYFYSNSGPGSCIASSYYYFDCESGRVFMTPSVTSLHSAWLQTSLYILMFAFLLGAYFWNGITSGNKFLKLNLFNTIWENMVSMNQIWETRTRLCIELVDKAAGF